MAQVIERYNVAAGKPYTTRDGEQKKSWINIGRATKWDDGGISIEFTAMPVGNWWDGKASLFVQDDSKQQTAPQRQQRSAPNRQTAPVDDFADDSIPF
jgi:hypothetical protein